jgi:hypothetical protein
MRPAAEQTTRLLFENLPPSWVLGLVLAPAVVLLAAWAYRRPERGPRRLLGVLRGLLLALAVALALGPYLRRSEVAEEPAPLALLVDDSASLQRRDALAPEALARLQEMGLQAAAEPQRIELLRALLAGSWPAGLAERYELSSWRFADRLAPAAQDGSDLAAEGRATALGSALLDLLAEHRGRRVPDVVVLSDGRSNAGADLEEAVARLAAEGVRVHAVALGDPRPAPDLALERVTWSWRVTRRCSRCACGPPARGCRPPPPCASPPPAASCSTRRRSSWPARPARSSPSARCCAKRA